jgi:hypothetical protein
MVHLKHFGNKFNSIDRSGNLKAKGRKPKSCLGQVFNFKLGCFVLQCNWKGMHKQAHI